MKTRFVAFLGLALVVSLAPVVSAQRGGGGGGQGGRGGGGRGGFGGGGFGGRGGGFQMPAALELMGLLRMPEVREEIELDEEELLTPFPIFIDSPMINPCLRR